MPRALAYFGRRRGCICFSTFPLVTRGAQSYASSVLKAFLVESRRIATRIECFVCAAVTTIGRHCRTDSLVQPGRPSRLKLCNGPAGPATIDYRLGRATKHLSRGTRRLKHLVGQLRGLVSSAELATTLSRRIMVSVSLAVPTKPRSRSLVSSADATKYRRRPTPQFSRLGRTD